MNYNFFIILFWFLFGVGLWQLSIISFETSVFLQVLSFSSICYYILFKKSKIPLLYKNYFIGIFICVLMSTFMAYYFHDQSILTTLIEQRFIYFFCIYFALCALNPSVTTLENSILFFTLFFAIIYILQYIYYPTEIFYFPKVLIERGTYRFRIDGFELLILSSLILLARKFYLKYFLIGFFAFVLFLSGSRFLMLMAALSIFIYFIKGSEKSNIKNIAFLSLLSFFLYQFIPGYILEDYFYLTFDQLDQGMEYIRLQSAIYFLQFSDNFFTILFGNGVFDSHTYFGDFIFQIGEKYGFWLSDIGLIGDYFRFGLLYLIIIISLIINSIRHSYSSSNIYFSYLLTILIYYIVSWPFGHTPGIILLSAVLFIVNKKQTKKTGDI